ncbi:MAG: pyruvate, phosphate dikinase, partial [Chloroflexi bacterium]|nr:pyruvate, phosphate dikinase [Chloroflexota bacterium]
IVEKSIRPPAMSEDAPDLTGTAASKGTYEGRARVAVGDYRFDQIDQGDVLVTSTHSEAFNAVAGRVGAIVTDTGGILSHLSIVSRELGIPCVVACKNATTVIPEGAMVRVDGNSGAVTILG